MPPRCAASLSLYCSQMLRNGACNSQRCYCNQIADEKKDETGFRRSSLGGRRFGRNRSSFDEKKQGARPRSAAPSIGGGKYLGAARNDRRVSRRANAGTRWFRANISRRQTA